MKHLRSALSQPTTWGFAAAAAAAFAVILFMLIRIWSPEYGITELIPIGTEFISRGTAVYRATPKYVDPVHPARWGFDGQLYAEIALDPLLRDPQYKVALDDPPYRAHRILLPVLAWIGGLGHPFWILNVYAALNPVFWLGYAVILYALFRRLGWAGVAGFSAMLLTCGFVESTRGTLTDFPAFVLMTLAAMIGGLGGAGTLALAALTREVNLIGLAGLVELPPPWGRAIRRNLLIGIMAGFPMILWFAYVAWRIGTKGPMAGGNLDWPLHAIALRVAEAVSSLRRGGFNWRELYQEPTEPHALLTIVATATQCVYVLAHPDWGSRLWRIGAAFVLLFVCLSSTIWGSFAYFTVTRHALPITLAFNLALAKRPGRWWLMWFVLGNCFVPAGIDSLVQFGWQAPRWSEIAVQEPAGAAATVSGRFESGWSGPERDRSRKWRWAVEDRATVVLTNAGPESRVVELSADLLSLTPDRRIRIESGAETLWAGSLGKATGLVKAETARFVLKPGDTEVVFATPEPAAASESGDPRRLAFMVSNLKVRVAPDAR